MPALLTDLYLLQSGLVPGQDVKWATGRREELRKGLLTGKLQALAVEEWLPAELVASGKGRVMVSLQRLWDDHPAELLAVGRDFGEANAQALRRMARATLRAARELDLGHFAPLGQKVTSGTKEAPAAWQEGLSASKAGFYPFPFLSGARIVMEEMKKRKQAPGDTDFARVAEATCLTGLCREVMKEVGYEAVPEEDSRDERMVGCCYTF